MTQGGREGHPVYACVVLLPDFEGSDARGVEDLVRELVYQVCMYACGVCVCVFIA